jgi:hypothetical protein
MAIKKVVKQPVEEDSRTLALGRLDGGTIQDVHVVLSNNRVESLRFSMADKSVVTITAHTTDYGGSCLQLNSSL